MVIIEVHRLRAALRPQRVDRWKAVKLKRPSEFKRRCLSGESLATPLLPGLVALATADAVVSMRAAEALNVLHGRQGSRTAR
ncbi:hypothetical protein [Streptomyces mirabilis]|uniref:hypothetical protein n=1 Tax=Streptomyces mirabilis TaxID=68239 RepID=UPI0036D16B73